MHHITIRFKSLFLAQQQNQSNVEYTMEYVRGQNKYETKPAKVGQKGIIEYDEEKLQMKT